MLNKAKQILCNEQGMETIEVIGMGVVALVAVAVFYNAAKEPMDTVNTKIGTGLTEIEGLAVATDTLAP